MSETDQLPPGWSVSFDPTYNCDYFHHAQSGKTQWERPLPESENEQIGEIAELGALDLEPHTISEVQKSSYFPTPVETEQGSPSDDVNYSSLIDNTTRENDVPQHQPVPDTVEEYAEVPRAAVGGSSQDYLGLAEMYKTQRLYASKTVSLPCVLCKQREVKDVFFPCQHRCVCPECIVLEQIVEHHHMALVPNAHVNCPLCGCIIKKIIPGNGGEEEEEYWKWVNEVNPHLPDGFLRNFRHSSAIIQKFYVVEKSIDNKPSMSCTIM